MKKRTRNPMVAFFEVGSKPRLRPISTDPGYIRKVLGGWYVETQVSPDWLLIRPKETDTNSGWKVAGRAVMGDFILAKTDYRGTIVSADEADWDDILVLTGMREEFSLI